MRFCALRSALSLTFYAHKGVQSVRNVHYLGPFFFFVRTKGPGMYIIYAHILCIKVHNLGPPKRPEIVHFSCTKVHVLGSFEKAETVSKCRQFENST